MSTGNIDELLRGGRQGNLHNLLDNPLAVHAAKEHSMNTNQERFKPAVDSRVLLLVAGFVWLGIGTMLLTFSCSWLHASPDHVSFLFPGTGLVLALVIHHFGFLKVVDRNLGRILPMEGKKCIFSFMTWKSYIIVGVMVAMGAFLRHSPIPKPYLSILYTGIGLALILSSVRYLRVVWSQSSRI